jgi:hypothetical protein
MWPASSPLAGMVVKKNETEAAARRNSLLKGIALATTIKKPSDRDIQPPFANPARCITMKEEWIVR